VFARRELPHPFQDEEFDLRHIGKIDEGLDFLLSRPHSVVSGLS
jgi:hypothetical protein